MRISAVVTVFAIAVLASSVGLAQEPQLQAQPEERVARFAQVDTIDSFAGFFNIAQGTVRIVAFLSPSCPECVNGFYEIKRIMEDIPSKRLRLFVVFMPVLERDQRSLAITLLGNYHNRRASYFWDPKFAVAEAFKSLAGSPEPVVDGYFLFDTNAVVRDRPDAPKLWLQTHKHGTTEAPTLDGSALEAAARELLERFEKGDRSRSPDAQE